MNNVFTMPAKRLVETYRGDKVVISYDPLDKVWTWTVTHQTSFDFDGTEKSLDAAKKAAHKKIDKIMGD